MADHHVESLTKLLQNIRAQQRPAVDPPTVVVAEPQQDASAVTVVQDVVIPRTVTIKNVFRHPDAHPLVLDLLLINKYGEDWLGWEHETFGVRVTKDFGVDSISSINIAKIQAMRTLHLVDTFWNQWEVFNWCTQPLNAIFPDFHMMQVPTVLQCMVAVDIANKVRDDVEWSDELKHYLAAVHMHDAVVVPQSPLAFVEVDSKGFPIDTGAVIEKWPSVKSTKKAPMEETPEAEQLRRMLALHQDLELRRAQMRQQLGVIRDA